MRWGALVFWLALLAAALFVPAPLRAQPAEVRRIGSDGVDRPCAPDFAHLEVPQRTSASPWALLDDFAYAAAEAGPAGCAWLLVGVALVAGFFGLWTGLRCALRRGLLALALGLPIGLGLLYHSCFLEGRRIVLGPAASEEVACSLHTQTNRTTGLLSPKQLVYWHARRGFRVLNVADKDTVAAAAAARAATAPGDGSPLVITGEEWHGSPHVLLIHIDHARDPEDEIPLEDMVAGVHAEGGAAFVAHPWSHLPPKRSVDEYLKMGLDGVEAVNEAIRGSDGLLATAHAMGKTLIGTIDYKFGPHVTAMTLLPASIVVGRGGDPTVEGVVEALRTGHTQVLYAVPGGARTGEAYRAGELGIAPAKAGLRSLMEVPRGRRAVWFGWLAFFALLWAVASREPRTEAGLRRLSPRLARVLFLACAACEIGLMAFLHWRVKHVVVVSVPVLLAAAAVLAVPLLASTVVLARAEREG